MFVIGHSVVLDETVIRTHPVPSHVVVRIGDQAVIEPRRILLQRIAELERIEGVSANHDVSE